MNRWPHTGSISNLPNWPAMFWTASVDTWSFCGARDPLTYKHLISFSTMIYSVCNIPRTSSSYRWLCLEIAPPGVFLASPSIPWNRWPIQVHICLLSRSSCAFRGFFLEEIDWGNLIECLQYTHPSFTCPLEEYFQYPSLCGSVPHILKNGQVACLVPKLQSIRIFPNNDFSSQIFATVMESQWKWADMVHKAHVRIKQIVLREWPGSSMDSGWAPAEKKAWAASV